MADFNVPIELEEVEEEFDQSFETLNGRLRQSFRSLPQLDQNVQDLVSQTARVVCQTFVEDVFERCRLKHGNSSKTSKRIKALESKLMVFREPAVAGARRERSGGSGSITVPYGQASQHTERSSTPYPPMSWDPASVNTFEEEETEEMTVVQGNTRLPPSLPHHTFPPARCGSDSLNHSCTDQSLTLSAQRQQKAALIRKLGGCSECRKRRVAVCAPASTLMFPAAVLDLLYLSFLPHEAYQMQCHPGHHNMVWDEEERKYKLQTLDSDHASSLDHLPAPAPQGLALDPPMADMGSLTSGGPIIDSTLDLGLDIDGLADFKEVVSPNTFAMFFDPDDCRQNMMGVNPDS